MIDKLISGLSLIGFSLISGFVLWHLNSYESSYLISIKSDYLVSFGIAIISGIIFLGMAYGSIILAKKNILHALYIEILSSFYLGLAYFKISNGMDSLGLKIDHANFIIMLACFFWYFYFKVIKHKMNAFFALIFTFLAMPSLNFYEAIFLNIISIAYLVEMHFYDHPKLNSFLKRNNIILSPIIKKNIERLAIGYLIIFPLFNYFNVEVEDSLYYAGLAGLAGFFIALNSKLSTYTKMFYISAFISFLNIFYKHYKSVPQTILIIGLLCLIAVFILKAIKKNNHISNLVPSFLKFLVIPEKQDEVKDQE